MLESNVHDQGAAIMSQLHNPLCEPCQQGAPQATLEEQQQWLAALNAWEPINRDDVLQLSKCYDFDNFTTSLAFANKVGVGLKSLKS